MARLRNPQTGVIVNVPDDMTLDGYEPFEGKSAEPTGYDALKVPELEAEIAKRNEGRDEADLLPTTGKKADLIAALTADDNK